MVHKLKYNIPTVNIGLDSQSGHVMPLTDIILERDRVVNAIQSIISLARSLLLLFTGAYKIKPSPEQPAPDAPATHFFQNMNTPSYHYPTHPHCEQSLQPKYPDPPA